MTTVKICGLKDAETLSAILHLPIDHIGFLFAKSKRQVTPKQAGELTRLVRERRERGQAVPFTVGVFVNPTLEQLEETLRDAPLDIVQLHGSESPDFCRRVKEAFGVRVYRVFSVTGDGSSGGDAEAEAALALEPYAGRIDGMLLDTAGGGTGVAFDWSRIPAYQAWARRQGIPLLVAGGLNPDNIASLIEAYGPDGVDVSSGVETDGTKDVGKITAFVERVKRHESHASA
ncbi:phosphoribosylanthranilate isomerase [Paenibacillus flagellatus]|uniref:N-(5'-phosphoribosyl)anthranilate isomerase n=1 Tax=Paenibacillus flagellatus TaxID=2211139 RepID=A0A2V5KAM2_9BACL|nr:phosphoribosylanthranilate isomerase [Paenibacillus flagellatus]PYI54913.1 N-(5'-phosphoribosyl)anthranilate isomerase [Paenibacillus flagellatus]